MIVLDASVLIALLDDEDAHHGAAMTILRASSPAALLASPVSVAEALVGPARAGQGARIASALDRLGLGTVPFDAASPLRLAELRASTGLRLPDCCVLLAAQQRRARLSTFDQRLAVAARALGLATDPAG